jgi:hypothetical protein
MQQVGPIQSTVTSVIQWAEYTPCIVASDAVNEAANAASLPLSEWNTAATPCQRQQTAHSCSFYNEYKPI